MFLTLPVLTGRIHTIYERFSGFSTDFQKFADNSLKIERFQQYRERVQKLESGFARISDNLHSFQKCGWNCAGIIRTWWYFLKKKVNEYGGNRGDNPPGQEDVPPPGLEPGKAQPPQVGPTKQPVHSTKRSTPMDLCPPTKQEIADSEINQGLSNQSTSYVGHNLIAIF